MVPSNVKIFGTVKAFKSVIKRWLPENFPCRLCKRYATKLALYEFLMYFVFTLVVFPLSHSFHINRVIDGCFMYFFS